MAKAKKEYQPGIRVVSGKGIKLAYDLHEYITEGAKRAGVPVPSLSESIVQALEEACEARGLLKGRGK